MKRNTRENLNEANLMEVHKMAENDEKELLETMYNSEFTIAAECLEENERLEELIKRITIKFDLFLKGVEGLAGQIKIEARKAPLDKIRERVIEKSLRLVDAVKKQRVLLDALPKTDTNSLQYQRLLRVLKGEPDEEFEIFVLWRHNFEFGVDKVEILQTYVSKEKAENQRKELQKNFKPRIYCNRVTLFI